MKWEYILYEEWKYIALYVKNLNSPIKQQSRHNPNFTQIDIQVLGNPNELVYKGVGKER